MRAVSQPDGYAGDMDLLKITIPKNSHVLVLEDSEMRIAWFEKKLSNVKVVRSVQEFQDYFATKPQVDFIFWDHDLGQGNGSGLEAAQWLADRFGGVNRFGLIHSWNANGAARMKEVLKQTYHIPFGDFDIEEF